MKNYPQKVVEWAGLAGENILNMGEIGRAEPHSFEMRACSPQLSEDYCIIICIILYHFVSAFCY